MEICHIASEFKTDFLFQYMFSTWNCPIAQVFWQLCRIDSIASGNSWQTQTLQWLIEAEQDRKLDIHLYNTFQNWVEIKK